MTLTGKIAAELLCVAINVGLAKWEAYRFDKQQERINHQKIAFEYGFATITPVVWVIAFGDLSWTWIWLTFSFITMHFPLFSAMLNYFRTPRRPFDYHNTSDSAGSKIDLWLGKYYVPVWWLSVLGWLGLQFLIF